MFHATDHSLANVKTMIKVFSNLAMSDAQPSPVTT
jgi:hypothetical protein